MNTRALSILTLLACCGAAIAQTPPSTSDPLRGPEVRDRQVPGVNGTFGEPGGEKKRFVGENRLPPRVFRDAMDTVLALDAPENLRVTDEQRTRFGSWMDDFQKSVGAYMKEHQQEIRELRAKTGEGAGGPGRRPGGKGGKGPKGADQPKPEKGDEMMRPDDNAPNEKDAASARERFQTLMAGAPKIEDLYTKIWTELKPDQQKAVDAKIADFRADQAKDREDNYVRQKSKKKNPQPPRPDQPDGQQKGQPGEPQGPAPQDGQPPRRRPNAQGAPGPDGSQSPFASRGQGVDPQRRERLMRAFGQMTPEQQEQLLQRIEQRLREEGGNKQPPLPGRPGRPGRRGGDQGPGEPKPAPQPDDSMMPPTPPEQAP